MFLEPCPPSTVVGDLDFLAVNPVESQPGPNALLPAYQRLPILALCRSASCQVDSRGSVHQHRTSRTEHKRR
jgi:hypothetical protein